MRILQSRPGPWFRYPGAALLMLACGAAIAQTGAATDARSIALTPSPQLRVNSYHSGDQQNPAVAGDAAGNRVVVWQSDGEDGSRSGIYARRIGANGRLLGREFRVNTFTTNLQILPAVAMNAAGAFVVVWDSVGQDGAGLSIRGQRYAANGAPLGAEFKINTSTRDLSTQLGVGMDSAGDFAVVWPEHATQLGVSATKTSRINLRAYGADGEPRGAPIEVAGTVLDNLRVPSLAMSDAGIVVTWNATGRGRLLSGPAGIGVGILARRFGVDGSAQGSKFSVNKADAGVIVDRPVAAIDHAGNFVIAWETLNLDQSAHGVYARRYGAGGEARAAEFVVGNVDTLQRSPALAISTAGTFAVAAHGVGVYLQAYRADGTADGGTQRVDDAHPADTSALSPALAMSDDGSLIVAWQDFRLDGDGRGIAARSVQLP